MKNTIKMLLLSSLLLGACTRHENNNRESNQQVSSPSASSSSATHVMYSSDAVSSSHVEATIEAYYRRELELARDKQQAYIDSLPKEVRNSVQTVFSAIFARGTELILAHEHDAALIQRLVDELTTGDNSNTVEPDVSVTQQIIDHYGNVLDTHFTEVSPATVREYYGLATPDQTLSMMHLNGNPIAIQVTEVWQLGSGEVYDLHACYVNESGTEVVLFVEKDGQKYVLQANSQPVDGKVAVSISQHPVLNQFK